MIKAEIVKGLIIEGMEFKTKKEGLEFADAKIKEVNDLIVKIGKALKVGEKAKFGDLEISKVEVAERSGTMNGKDWTTPAHESIKVKLVEEKAK